MFKPPASALAILFAVCVPADGQRNRPIPEAGRGGDRAPLVFLDSTREGDGLTGPVRRIETEVSGVEMRQGKPLPKPPSLLERTLYDERGRRIENETYPVVGSRVGQETHTYDSQGNVAETVVRDSDGAVLSRTIYQYEYDAFGNWIKMTASVAVSNSSGRVEYEPTEITKRSITYYLVAEPNGRAAPGGTGGAAGGAPAEAVKVSNRAAASDAKARPMTQPGPSAGAEAVDVGVLNDRATWFPKPAFPVRGERLAEPITVSVEVVIDITGRVVAAQAREGPKALRESAVRAARLATFLPLYVAGRPVRSKGLINYTFNYLP